MPPAPCLLPAPATVRVHCLTQLPGSPKSFPPRSCCRQSLGQSLGLGAGDVGGGTVAGQEYELRGRRLRVVRQLGEGGYSFVYLVRQLQTGPAHGGSTSSGALAAAAAVPGAGQLWALKRVRAGMCAVSWWPRERRCMGTLFNRGEGHLAVTSRVATCKCACTMLILFAHPPQPHPTRLPRPPLPRSSAAARSSCGRRGTRWR